MNTIAVRSRDLKAAIDNHPDATVLAAIFFVGAVALLSWWLFVSKPDAMSLEFTVSPQTKIVAMDDLETRGIHASVSMDEFQALTINHPHSIGIWSGWQKGETPGFGDKTNWKVWYFADFAGLKIIATQDIPYVSRWGWGNDTQFRPSASTFTTVPYRSYWLLLPMALLFLVSALISLFIFIDA